MRKLIPMALAVCLVTACEKPMVSDDDIMKDDDGLVLADQRNTKKFTFTLKGDFSEEWKSVTRGYLQADGKDMTDLWVLDYIDGTLVQQVHQSDNTAENFGKPQMTLSYGSHHIYFVASRGVDPVLNFRDMKRITEIYERVTRMQVHPRQPYGGALVFSAFSGSHQDAIAKGMAYRQEKQLETWSVPYLPIDPEDVGRTYDSDVIRINSQSGKGGVSYILKQSFGIALPDKMKEEFGYLVKDVSDKEHKELTPEWIYSILEYN
jgi:hypothetical protein